MQQTFIITGKQGSGKTTLLLEVVQMLKQQGTRVGGIAAVGCWKEGVRDSFDLLDLQSGDTCKFLQRVPVEGWEKLRRFYVNPQGQRFGETALDPEHLKNVDLIVIDEIGPFELQAKGWAKALDKIFNTLDKPLLVVVRESLTAEIADRYNFTDPYIFHEKRDSLKKFLDDLVASF